MLPDMTLKSRLVSLLALASLVSLSPVHARAAARVAPAGKVRLHIDTEAFGWTQGRDFYEPGEMKDPFNPRYNLIGFGAGRPIAGDSLGTDSAGSLTLNYSLIGIGVGYGIHRNLILGARLGFNANRIKDRNDNPMDPNDDAATVLIGGFTPYLEILPIAEGTVLPYILVRGGFVGSTFALRGPDSFSRYSTMAPTMGIGGGAHAFLTPYFSLDFGLTFDYRWILSRARFEVPGVPNVQPEWARASQSFTLAGTIGLSTWF